MTLCILIEETIGKNWSVSVWQLYDKHAQKARYEIRTHVNGYPGTEIKTAKSTYKKQYKQVVDEFKARYEQ